jgi:hypothetical protein
VAPRAVDLFGEPIEAHPAWFRPRSFLRADFDPDAYVAELRAHLAALRAELVGLINRDYADFVGLSARLGGVDAAAARMRAPFANLRARSPPSARGRPQRWPRTARASTIERRPLPLASFSTPRTSSPRFTALHFLVPPNLPFQCAFFFLQPRVTK